MVGDERLAQLAMMTSQNEVLVELNRRATADRLEISPQELAQVHQIVQENARPITRYFWHEVIVRGDITTGAQARAYLEERLAFFGELIAPETQSQIREWWEWLASRMEAQE